MINKMLEEANVELIAMKRLEWFEHVKRIEETENIRAVAIMKTERKHARGRPG